MENKKDTKRILLDFDGSVLTNENYPSIGKDIGAIPVLKKLVENGHKLILWTRRDGFALDNAIKWFKDNEIDIADVNPKYGSKIDYDMIIDDKALNMPLKELSSSEKPYINWVIAKIYLQKLGVL